MVNINGLFAADQEMEQAAITIQRAWRTYVRLRPKNHDDPLTLEPLNMISRKFYVVTKHGICYCYDAVALATYIESSSEAKDPLSGEYYNAIELRRLDRAAGTCIARDFLSLKTKQYSKKVDSSIVEYLSNEGLEVIDELHEWIALLGSDNWDDIVDGTLDCHFPTLVNITLELIGYLNNPNAVQDFVDSLLNRLGSSDRLFQHNQQKMLANVRDFLSQLENITYCLYFQDVNEEAREMVDRFEFMQVLSERLEEDLDTPDAYRIMYEASRMEDEFVENDEVTSSEESDAAETVPQEFLEDATSSSSSEESMSEGGTVDESMSDGDFVENES